MADITVTPSLVLATNTNTTKNTGTAGAAINAGQVIYLDSASNTLKLAQGTAQIQAQAVQGIALDSAAGSGEPLTYASAGDVTLGTSAVLTTGLAYVLATDTAGAIAPSIDPPSAGTSFITTLGLATSPTNLRLGIIALGAPR